MLKKVQFNSHLSSRLELQQKQKQKQKMKKKKKKKKQKKKKTKKTELHNSVTTRKSQISEIYFCPRQRAV